MVFGFCVVLWFGLLGRFPEPAFTRECSRHGSVNTQCSTLVDNVLSRHACKQCCDVRHVGLGYVGLFCVLPYLLSSVSSLYVPVRFLMMDLLLCSLKGFVVLNFQPFEMLVF